MRILFSILTVIVALSTSTHGQEKPNIVLMFLGNIGYGDLGCYGNTLVKTPRIDRLAREGVRCTSFHTVPPPCLPGAGALLTGRTPLSHGLNEQLYKIDEREQTLDNGRPEKR